MFGWFPVLPILKAGNYICLTLLEFDFIMGILVYMSKAVEGSGSLLLFGRFSARNKILWWWWGQFEVVLGNSSH